MYVVDDEVRVVDINFIMVVLTAEGVMVGLLVGLNEGIIDGATVGPGEGGKVGFAVGLLVGASLGDLVGLAVGNRELGTCGIRNFFTYACIYRNAWLPGRRSSGVLPHCLMSM